ncbi:MAG: DUF4843 domain-containing protein [Bacteroidales bacterium]|nr:DUF4843 domain-containing protein [Bacteroidales bacterium]
MKRYILTLAAVLLCLSACKKSEIQTFKVEDCSVSFNGIENSFSLRGWTEEFKDLHVPVKVLGIPVDYDREITLDIRDSIATAADYQVLSSVIKAGELKADIIVRAKTLADDVEQKVIIMSIVPNDYFRAGEPNYQKAIVKWTNSYARPVPDVWKNWYLYISTGYSKALHKILVAEYGDEIDFCVRRLSESTPENGLIYKDPTWWSALNKRVREIVRDHDLLHPDSPYMHSEDYEDYPNASTPVGQGRKPAVIPTIYSTLVSL